MSEVRRNFEVDIPFPLHEGFRSNRIVEAKNERKALKEYLSYCYMTYDKIEDCKNLSHKEICLKSTYRNKVATVVPIVVKDKNNHTVGEKSRFLVYQLKQGRL